MKPINRLLEIRQIDRKLLPLHLVRGIALPGQGWLRTIRTALNLSLRQVGERLDITPQSIQDIERREKEGTVTIKTLRETAKAMDLQLVYFLVPYEETLEKQVERRAYEMATRIIRRTSMTMRLEDQENSEERLKQAIDEMAAEIMREIPGKLWD